MKWDRIRRDIESGLYSFQSVARYVAERTRVETSLAKVVYDTQKIRKKIDEKYRELGERLYELRDEKNPTENAVIRDLLSECSGLKEELDFYMTRAGELGRKPLTEEPDDEEPDSAVSDDTKET